MDTTNQSTHKSVQVSEINLAQALCLMTKPFQIHYESNIRHFLALASQNRELAKTYFKGKVAAIPEFFGYEEHRKFWDLYIIQGGELIECYIQSGIGKYICLSNLLESQSTMDNPRLIYRNLKVFFDEIIRTIKEYNFSIMKQKLIGLTTTEIKNCIDELDKKYSIKDENTIEFCEISKYTLDSFVNSSGVIPTGIASIDEEKKIRGWQAGRLTILAARPGIGKTALAFSSAVEIARAGKKVLFCSIEMTGEGLKYRYLAARAGVLFSKLMSKDADTLKGVSEYEKDLLKNVGENLYVADAKIAKTTDEIIELANTGEFDIIFIDHLHELRDVTQRAGFDRSAYIGDATQKFSRLAQDSGSAVVLLAQLNRQSANEKRAPGLQDLRYSGEIEQIADVVMFLYGQDDEKTSGVTILDDDTMKKMSQEELSSIRPLFVEIQKNRYGISPVTVVTLFNKQRQEFMKMPEQEIPWG